MTDIATNRDRREQAIMGDEPKVDKDRPTTPKKAKTGGRQKGTPNRVTRDIRTALRDLAERNADNAQVWLDRVAATDPAEAMRLYLALLRFTTPTLTASAIADVTPPPSPIRHRLARANIDERLLLSPQVADLIASGSVHSLDDIIEAIAGVNHGPLQQVTQGSDPTISADEAENDQLCK
jgi:hypothetical protein